MEVLHLLPEGFQVAAHQDQILLSAGLIPNVVMERCLLAEAQPPEDAQGRFLRPHHLDDDLLDLGLGQRVQGREDTQALGAQVLVPVVPLELTADQLDEVNVSEYLD